MWSVPGIVSLLAICLIASPASQAGGGSSCGYESCHPTHPDLLNVHLVPHSHDDVGWLETVDQYYVDQVQFILDGVVKELKADPAKRFIYVEMAFFWRWFKEQDQATRQDVRDLVANGQLEFTNGGWSMNDEAATHYAAIVDQMTLGFKFLTDTFGPGNCSHPKVAWHIDPFGHSKEQANLFEQMGFDGFLFARIDYGDKIQRLRDKSLEMMWKPRPESKGIFTAALYGPLYMPPKGFCYETWICDDPQIVDDPSLKSYNLPERVSAFVRTAKRQASHFRTNNIMFAMGADFNYVTSHSWFKNMDKIIKHVNSESQQNGLNVIYSTPACYMKALKDAAGVDWPLKTDDFFPYASAPHEYWTGYFTSRPSLKLMIRKASGLLQSCKQMGIAHYNSGIEVMKRAVAVNQHHDAVTGTAKQAVTADYALRLSEGFDKCSEIASEFYSGLQNLKNASSEKQLTFVHCPLLNISQCSPTDSATTNFVVNVYNPLVRPIGNKIVRLPVSGGHDYTVRDRRGEVLTTQIVPIAQPVLEIPGRTSPATHDLVFKATPIPPMGFESFHVTRSPGTTDSEARSRRVKFRGGINVVTNGLTNLTFNRFGRLKMVDGARVSQGFGWYEGFSGADHTPPSGAYLFRPTKQAPNRVGWAHSGSSTHFSGPVVQEVHQRTAVPWISQVVRLYEGQPEAEFEWLVGPIPVEDGVGKEVVIVYDRPDVRSNGEFWTDANGRQMVKRERDKRETWQLNSTEPVSQNYYPVNTRMVVKDRQNQMTVLTDRSQGGTSMKDGQLEIMLHRRLLHDDNKGVDEALNETAYGVGLVAKGTHWLKTGDPGSKNGGAARWHRLRAQQVFMDASLTVVPTELSYDDFVDRGHAMHGWAALKVKEGLPENLHLMTIEELVDNEWEERNIGDPLRLLVRLEHLFDTGEDKELSRPLEVDLSTLFTNFSLQAIQEKLLGANVDLNRHSRGLGGTLPVKINPMQIRTFVLTGKITQLNKT